MLPISPNFDFEKNFSDKSFSYQTMSHPKPLYEVKFVSSSFNSTHIIGMTFVDCHFDDCDMTNVTIEDCTFNDCSMVNTAIINANLIGCHFLCSRQFNDSPFNHSSFQDSIFKSSQSRDCKFENCEFGHVVFKSTYITSTEFINCFFQFVPKDAAIFENCYFTKLNLLHGTIKGLQLINCKVDQLEVTFEKILSIIGIYEILKTTDFIITKRNHAIEQRITSLNKVATDLEDSMKDLPSAGGLFEYLCAVSFLSQFVKESSDYIENSATKAIACLSKCPAITGDIHVDIESQIDYFINASARGAIHPNMINIKYALDLVERVNVFNIAILHKFLSLIRVATAYGYTETQAAAVKYKLGHLQNLQTQTHICIVFRDKSVLEVVPSTSETFSFALKTLIELAGISALTRTYREEGSIVEKLILSKTDFVDSYPKLLGIMFIIGFNFHVDMAPNNWRVRFHFGSASSNVTAKPNVPAKMEDEDKIIDVASEKLSECLAGNNIGCYDSMTKKELKELLFKLQNSRLMESNFVKRPDQIAVNVQPASIAQIANQPVEKMFLDNRSTVLALPEQ